MSQDCWLGPKVGSRLALFCIHRINQVKARNESESQCQHHKYWYYYWCGVEPGKNVGYCFLKTKPTSKFTKRKNSVSAVRF